jgi:DMSO/TMAO reductase YedYZ heme-binding membrane subunit
MKNLAYLISAVIVLIFSWYYFMVRGLPLSIPYLNAVAAFSSMILIALSAIMGPIARFVPQIKGVVQMRRPFGLVGFGLAGLHVALVVPNLLMDVREATLGDVASIAFAAVAFMIFTLMALTSTSRWVEKLGLENWKNLQRMGYLAMVFIIFHVILLEQGVFLNRLTGQVAILVVLAAILARATVLALKKPEVEQNAMHLVMEN